MIARTCAVVLLALASAFALPGEAAAAGCGGHMEDACDDKYRNAKYLGKAPKFAATSKACVKAYGKGAVLKIVLRQCWSCPAGYSSRAGKVKRDNACKKRGFRRCDKGLKRIKAGGGDFCAKLPDAPKKVGLSVKASGALITQAAGDLKKYGELIKAMTADLGRIGKSGAEVRGGSGGDGKMICRFKGPSDNTRKVASGTGHTTTTLELIGDVQVIRGWNWSIGYATYIGIDAADKGYIRDNGKPVRYATATQGTSWGASLGGDGSISLGAWKGGPADLAGKSHNVTVAVS